MGNNFLTKNAAFLHKVSREFSKINWSIQRNSNRLFDQSRLEWGSTKQEHPLAGAGKTFIEKTWKQNKEIIDWL